MGKCRLVADEETQMEKDCERLAVDIELLTHTREPQMEVTRERVAFGACIANVM
jgi:hypothetical protein